MSDAKINEHLHRVIRLSHDMIKAADAGDEYRTDRGCGIVFGKLRDVGYEVRNLASRELEAHGQQATGQAVATTQATTPEALENLPKRILIVDDDPDIVTFLTRWFEDQGCVTLEAGNGLEAIELAVTRSPDLITLDMSMPEKSGVSTYRDLKGDPALREIPVIIITGIGKAFGEFIHRRRSVPDPEGFIAKPIDLAELTNTVERLLA